MRGAGNCLYPISSNSMYIAKKTIWTTPIQTGAVKMKKKKKKSLIEIEEIPKEEKEMSQKESGL